MEVVASLDDPQAIEETIARTHASVLVLDISMRNFNAVKAVRDFKAAFPALKILIASMHDEPVFVIDLVNAGVDGYYLKSERLQLLPEAIREVSNGTGWFSRSVGTTVARMHGARTPSYELTDREIMVLKSCANGASTAELAKAPPVNQNVPSGCLGGQTNYDARDLTCWLFREMKNNLRDPRVAEIRHLLLGFCSESRAV